jgi:hypothetical protein
MRLLSANFTINLNEWEEEAVLDHVKRMHPNRPWTVEQALSFLAHRFVKHAATRGADELQEEVVILMPIDPSVLEGSDADWPRECARIWDMSYPGHREEFLERIHAVKRPGCPLWEVDPLEPRLGRAVI